MTEPQDHIVFQRQITRAGRRWIVEGGVTPDGRPYNTIYRSKPGKIGEFECVPKEQLSIVHRAVMRLAAKAQKRAQDFLSKKKKTDSVH